MARRVIVPAVLALWGVAVVVHRLTGSTASHTGGAYHSGQNAAAYFGAVVAVVAAAYLVRGVRGRG